MPAGTTVIIRMEYTDYLGTFVYHCHRVDHEDDGMMALVKVLPAQSILAVGAGAGGAPQVNVYNGVTNAHLQQFNAFDAGFMGGVNVAIGDVNNDGISDIVCAAGPGGGPQVRAISGKDFSNLYLFFAFDAGFTGGVNIAAGDINSDGFDDLICAAGAGGGPTINTFQTSSIHHGAMAEASPSTMTVSFVSSFSAFAPGFTGGVRVGSLNKTLGTNYLAGAGPSGGPQVTTFDGISHAIVDNFFAFGEGFTGGVSVAAN